MKILIVDLTNNTTYQRDLSDELAGGRLLSGQLVSEFVDPQSEPLSPDNALVLASGVLSNRRVSTGSRLSIGCKSPLTGGIKNQMRVAWPVIHWQDWDTGQ